MDYELDNAKETEIYKKCKSCGQMLTASAKFCPICGASAAEAPGAQNVTDSRIPAGTTKKEYRKRYAPAALNKELKTLSIIGYVLVGINVVTGLLLNVYALVDAVLLLALVLGVHKGKSQGCAVAILVYSAFGMVVSLISAGTPAGWGWLALGIGMLSTFRKMDKQYAKDLSGM